MAGLAGLPYFIQYQGQLQEQQRAQQQAQMQLSLFQQQQADRRREQAAQAAAGNALPALLAGGMPAQQPQMPPPPQPPAPGQASQPVQQARGGVSLPGMGPAGQVVRPPLPPGGVGNQAPQLPPFRPLPTTLPQAAAPQGAIPAPPAPAMPSVPQAGGLTLQGAVQALKSQGLEGADLMAGLAQLTPILDVQAKQQSAQLQLQFNNEMKLAQLQERKDEARQRAEDRSMDRADRAQARAELAAYRASELALRREMVNFRESGGGRGGAVATPTNATEVQPGGTLPPAQGAGPLSAAAVDQQAWQDLMGGTNVGLNRDPRVVAAIKNRQAQIAASIGLNPEDIIANSAELKGDLKGIQSAANREANIGMAVREADKFATIAQDASALASRTGSPWVNTFVQSVQKNTGDTRITDFTAANKSLANAYARATTGSGATVHSQEEAESMLNTALNPQQYAGVIAQLKKEMDAAMQSSEQTRAQFSQNIRDRAAKMRAGGKPAAAGTPTTETTKVLNGVTYVQRNGKWYEQ